jgi:putative acetyltransferase
MNIRQETEGDFGDIYLLVKTAFETAAVAEGDEQDYVDEVRAGGSYIPELSLVAEQDGKIIGHIMLAKTIVHDNGHAHEHLVLAILSVAEEHRHKGVGASLVYVALDRAKSMGYRAIFIAGYPNYYRRFGFAPASGFGIRYKKDVPSELLDCIMALELVPKALDGVTGIVDL